MEAVTLHSLPYNLARSIGPAAGALLLTTAGPGVTFGVAGASHLGFAVILALLTIRPTARVQSKDRSVRSGVRYVRQDGVMLLLLVAIGIIGVGTDPVITLTPAIAERLGGDGSLVGMLAAAFGVGAALGYALLGPAQRRLGRYRVGPIGMIVMTIGMGGLTFSPTVLPSVLLLGCAGIG